MVTIGVCHGGFVPAHTRMYVFQAFQALKIYTVSSQGEGWQNTEKGRCKDTEGCRKDVTVIHTSLKMHSSDKLPSFWFPNDRSLYLTTEANISAIPVLPTSNMAPPHNQTISTHGPSSKLSSQPYDTIHIVSFQASLPPTRTQIMVPQPISWWLHLIS